MRIREQFAEPDFTRPADFTSVIPNAYESYGAESICNDNNWELLQQWGDVAIVRNREAA